MLFSNVHHSAHAKYRALIFGAFQLCQCFIYISNSIYRYVRISINFDSEKQLRLVFTGLYVIHSILLFIYHTHIHHILILNQNVTENSSWTFAAICGWMILTILRDKTNDTKKDIWWTKISRDMTNCTKHLRGLWGLAPSKLSILRKNDTSALSSVARLLEISA